MNYEVINPDFDYVTEKFSSVQQASTCLFTDILFFTLKGKIKKTLFRSKDTGQHITEYEFSHKDAIYIRKERFIYDENKENKSKFVIDSETKCLGSFSFIYFSDTIKMTDGKLDMSNFEVVESKTEESFFNNKNEIFFVLKECDDIELEHKVHMDKGNKKPFEIKLDGPFYISKDNEDMLKLL